MPHVNGPGTPATQARTRNKAKNGSHFAHVTIPLLQEYSDKLAEIGTQAQILWDKRAERLRLSGKPGPFQDYIRLLRSRFNRLHPAAKKLAQHVSQQIEFGSLDDLAKLELTLRLSEFEGTLAWADELYCGHWSFSAVRNPASWRSRVSEERPEERQYIDLGYYPRAMTLGRAA